MIKNSLCPSFTSLVSTFRDKQWIYLNTGTCSPLIDIVQESMINMIRNEANPQTTPWLSATESVDSLRESLSRLISVPSNEITIIENATSGLLLVLNGIRWNGGDEIIIIDDSHASAFVPVFAIMDRYDVSITIINTDTIFDKNKLQLYLYLDNLITSKTKLIVLSHVTWNTGKILPLPMLLSWARSRKILSVVDGAQGMGHVPISLRTVGCDAYVFSGHKWLLGPPGTGAAWMTSEFCESLWPSQAGCSGVSGFTMDGRLAWRGGSSRLETSTRNVPIIAGWNTAVQIISEIGLDEISERIMGMSNKFRSWLRILIKNRDDIYHIIGDAGITIMTGDWSTLNKLYGFLSNNLIVVRLINRSCAIRFSIHGFNSNCDIERTITLINQFLVNNQYRGVIKKYNEVTEFVEE